MTCGLRLLQLEFGYALPGHMLRASWRRFHCGKLATSTRHELHGEVIPPYDEQRCTKVRKKAPVTGAIQSAKAVP